MMVCVRSQPGYVMLGHSPSGCQLSGVVPLRMCVFLLVVTSAQIADKYPQVTIT
jgi:hypothetical protein